MKHCEGGDWFCCPACGKRLLRVGPDTSIRRLEYKCKACKAVFEVNTGEPEPTEAGAIGRVSAS